MNHLDWFLSFHGSDDCVELFSFDSELLEVVDIFVFAFSGNFLNPKSEILKKFMHVYILLQNENAPSVASCVLTHQVFEHFYVNKPQIIHFTINPAQIHSKNSNFVSVHTV